MKTQNSRDWAKQMLEKFKAKHGGRLPEYGDISREEACEMVIESYPNASRKEAAYLISWLTQD